MARFRLFIVRHGETAASRARRFAGTQDVPLTEVGVRQGEAIAQALAGHPVTAVYSSPLECARTSAEIIAKPHRLDVRIDRAFREMAFGPWEGLSQEEAEAGFPEAWGQWRKAPGTLVLPGGEPLGAVADRVGRGLERLAAAHAQRTLVLVSHAIVVRPIVLGALGLGLDRLWAVDASPAGISEIEFEPTWATVHRMNTLAHLGTVGV